METAASPAQVHFETSPDRYRHWKLTYDGPVATLAMDVQEDAGLSADYRLKLNSYDLGVDIELADAIQRIRFEHPEVHAVVITSGKERVFCAGANIFMLRGASHASKVNFCKYTNETRLAIEDASAVSGIRKPAASRARSLSASPSPRRPAGLWARSRSLQGSEGCGSATGDSPFGRLVGFPQPCIAGGGLQKG